MPNLDRLKREILREAVRENVDNLEGRPPKGLRARRRVLRVSLRAAAVLVVPLAVFVSINAISGRPSQPELVVVSAGAVPTRGPGAVPGSLPAPRRIDPSVFRLTVEKIVLDPGHGGSDSGARTPNGLMEKEVTLDVARRLKTLLEEASFRVALTREADEGLSLRERALFANAERADLFVSIHVNSIPALQHRGVETYYLGAADDPHASRLAGTENQESGYSLADFRTLLEGIYVDVRQAESRKLADAVQRGLVASLRRGSPGLENRGVKSAPFVVLVATEMPGILAEVSCVSNVEEAGKLLDPAYRQSIARALFEGLRAYAEARNRPAEKGT